MASTSFIELYSRHVRQMERVYNISPGLPDEATERAAQRVLVQMYHPVTRSLVAQNDERRAYVEQQLAADYAKQRCLPPQ